MPPHVCPQCLKDKKFCDDQLSNLHRPKFVIQKLLKTVGKVLKANDIQFVFSNDVTTDSPPHRTLWNKMVVKATGNKEGDIEDTTTAAPPTLTTSTSLFKVGLDMPSFITSMVEGITINRSSRGHGNNSRSLNKSAQGSVLCIPMYNAGHDYPYGACYFKSKGHLRSDEQPPPPPPPTSTINPTAKEESLQAIEETDESDNVTDAYCNTCALSAKTQPHNPENGMFDQSCVDRCQTLVENNGQQYVYRALKRKQRPTSARALHIQLAKEKLAKANLNSSLFSLRASKKRKKRFTADDIYRELKLQILNNNDSSPRRDRSKAKAANATIGPPPPQPNTVPKERYPTKESSAVAAVVAVAAKKKDVGKKKRNKRKKKPKKRKQKQKLQPQKDDIAIDTLLNQDGQSNNLYHSGDGKGEDWTEEPWQAKDNGWGVRRTSQSAAVVVKNRLTTKTQEARPATLAGIIAPMKPTKPPLPVGSGLSGRRKGFMSWIHNAAKAQKKKVLGMKLTTKETTISGHAILRSEKKKRLKKERTNNNVMVVPWGSRSNHTESSQKVPLHRRKIGNSRNVGGAGCSKLPRLPLL